MKFREKLSQFPDPSSTLRLRPNEDVLAIKAKFAHQRKGSCQEHRSF
jgi:hypothetical protein